VIIDEGECVAPQLFNLVREEKVYFISASLHASSCPKRDMRYVAAQARSLSLDRLHNEKELRGLPCTAVLMEDD
jgi:hypothetical protein